MAMNANVQLLQQRAVWLATTLLTRNASARVFEEQSAPFGIDLRIKLFSSEKWMGREFGVELKARSTIERLGRLKGNTLQLSGQLREDLARVQRSMRDVPYPLLFMVFEMQQDRCFFGWLKKPATAPQLMLEFPRLEVASAWGQETHDDVIRAVATWYDAKASTSPQWL